MIKGTGGLRKARVPFEHREKRGSARVCYVDFVFVETVYFITVYAKNEKDNLSMSERNQIRRMIELLEKNLKGDQNAKE